MYVWAYLIMAAVGYRPIVVTYRMSNKNNNNFEIIARLISIKSDIFCNAIKIVIPCVRLV
jgi:hypothetical protein